jgi:zinc protease
MKKWKKIIGLAIGSLLFSHAALAKVKIQSWHTADGISVFFVKRNHLPMVDMRIIFRAGSVYDGKQFGLAKLTNEAIGRKASTLSTQQILSGFDNVGAEFYQQTTRDYAAVSLRTLSEKKYLKPAVNLFLKVVGDAKFNEKDLKLVKQQLSAYIGQKQQDPAYIALRQFYQTLYQKHPYAHSVAGGIDGLRDITCKSVQQFYTRYYNRSNATIVIVGDLTTHQARALSESISHALHVGKKAPLVKPVMLPKLSQYAKIKMPTSQTAVVLGGLSMTQCNLSQMLPMTVASLILGGLPLDAVLFKSVRDKRGLTYNISSNVSSYAKSGVFFIMFKTRNEKMQEAIRVTRKTLHQFVNEGPSLKQFNIAKQFLLGQLQTQLASNKNLLDLLTITAFYQLPVDRINTLPSRLQHLTLKQVKDAIRQWVKPETMNLVTVGQYEKTK